MEQQSDISQSFSLSEKSAIKKKNDTWFFLCLLVLSLGAATMSAHLQWLVYGTASSFMSKRNKQTYSTEPNHLKSSNSFCYNSWFAARRWVWSLQPTAEVWWSSWSRYPATESQPTPPTCGPPSIRTPRPPSTESAHDLRIVLPGSMHGCHPQSQHHPAQPETRDGEEEAGLTHQESLSTLTPKIMKVLAGFSKKKIIIMMMMNATYHWKMGNFQPYVPFSPFWPLDRNAIIILPLQIHGI